MLCVVLVVVAIGVLLANPVSDQVSAFQRNVPDLVDDANATLADFQDWLDRNGVDVQVKDEGQTALADARASGSPRARASSSRSPATRWSELVEASIALILIVVLSRLHAALRRADRRRASARSCRAATARARTTSRRGSRPRCSATSAASSCSR